MAHYVTPEQIQNGVSKFVKNDLLSLAPDGILKFAVETAANAYLTRAIIYLNQMQSSDINKTLGLAQDGKIDIEAFYTSAKQAYTGPYKIELPSPGLQKVLSMLGNWTITDTDIDKLYNYIISC